MYFDANVRTLQEKLRIDRWLVANGVREHVTVDYPVIVRGRYIEYGAMCRRDRKSVARNDWIGRDRNGDPCGTFKIKKVRIRIPFSDVP